METDKSSTGHPGVDWEAGATIRCGVQIESWLTNYERETVFEIQTRGVGQEVADSEGIPFFGTSRESAKSKVNVARGASRLNTKFHGVTTFQQPR
jgi:hypothetical protein